MSDPSTNIAELSVGELSSALKRTIEDGFGHVRVRGEVSGYRGPHSSGHVYFCLKDQNARIDAVIWKGAFGKMRVRPEEGLEVVATGKITTFPGKSSYQIVIEQIELAGLGALMALLEQRRRKLAAEGLFDDGRKQLLPALPRRIGVVTSPTGAVIRDILHRIADRFPRHVLVWPVRVQGETSAEEVAAAIRGFNALPPDGPIPPPDLIIVARGGGSLEDLWGFNDEAVVRAAAESMIPLISAVGHETDWTLIDHAADIRAPTPTAAAELAVPVRAELLTRVGHLGQRAAEAALRSSERRRAELAALQRVLPTGEDLLAPSRQGLDRAGERLVAAQRFGREQARTRLQRADSVLQRHSPRAELTGRRATFDGLQNRLERCGSALSHDGLRRLSEASGRLTRAFAGRMAQAKGEMEFNRSRITAFALRGQTAWRGAIERRRDRIAALGQLLGSLSYRNVLARGFALVRDAEGRTVMGAAACAPGARLDIEFSDGRLTALVAEPAEGASALRPAARGAKKKSPGGGTQGDLF